MTNGLRAAPRLPAPRHPITLAAKNTRLMQTMTSKNPRATGHRTAGLVVDPSTWLRPGLNTRRQNC